MKSQRIQNKRQIRTVLTAKQATTYDYLYNCWIKLLQQEIDSLDSILVVCCGPRGSGKSTCMIKTALDLDPWFNADQVGFTKIEVLGLIQGLAYFGSQRVVIFDEFGSEMLSRNWFERTQKTLVRCLQVMRDTKVSLIVIMPHIKYGDTIAQNLGNFCVEMYRPAHKVVPYRIGKILESYGFYSVRKSKEFKPVWLKNRIFHVPFINPIHEHQDLFSQYWKKKEAFIMGLLAQDNAQDAQGLNETQTKYLKAFVSGLPDKQIAKELGVTPRTVRRQKKDLKDLGVF